ncbi:MAG: alanine racemase [Lachnospiraceae bacterium]|nr:alanine racemase [Lachnospiraceae bacterium]
MEHCDRIWAEIDLSAIRFNIESMKKNISEGTQIIAVIKADGYGHGAVHIAALIEKDSRVWGYAVATAQEALELRENGMEKPILMLGCAFPCDYGTLIKNDVRPTVFTYEMAAALSVEALKQGKICKIHLKIDTGMGRIGMQPDEEALETVMRIAELEGIETEGIFTHFARADEEDKTKAYAQLEQFSGFTQRLEAAGIHIPMKHCSNSAGIAEMPEANMNAVRAGIILYGLWPSSEVRESAKIALKPVLSLKSQVVYVKNVTAGQEIGYGGTYTTKRKTRVATICAGYGDGYPRALSNKGYVLLNGQRAPIIGRVCMDQFMVDVTDVKGEVCAGSVAVLIGREQGEEITMEALGELSGRFNYELACDLGKRIPRIYNN